VYKNPYINIRKRKNERKIELNFNKGRNKKLRPKRGRGYTKELSLAEKREF
jgi:hypothetical protein